MSEHNETDQHNNTERRSQDSANPDLFDGVHQRREVLEHHHDNEENGSHCTDDVEQMETEIEIVAEPETSIHQGIREYESTDSGQDDAHRHSIEKNQTQQTIFEAFNLRHFPTPYAT